MWLLARRQQTETLLDLLALGEGDHCTGSRLHHHLQDWPISGALDLVVRAGSGLAQGWKVVADSGQGQKPGGVTPQLRPPDSPGLSAPYGVGCSCPALTLGAAH